MPETLSIPLHFKFIFAGAAGISSITVVYPLDLIKNRMQMSGAGGRARDHKTTLHAIRNIFIKEGLLGFYSGLSAGIFRQATYTTMRLGIYTYVNESYSSKNGTPSLAMKCGLGMSVGAIASLICTPADLAMVRMTTDGRLPLHKRRLYSNVFNALYRISNEEGVIALWRGCGPTVLRAMATNSSTLGSYSQAKQSLLQSGYVNDNIYCHFIASFISGMACTVSSLPFDIAKTRMQSMHVAPYGKWEYKGTFHTMFKIARTEGVLSLWKGITAYFVKLAPYQIGIFISLEQFNKLYFHYVLGVQKQSGGL